MLRIGTSPMSGRSGKTGERHIQENDAEHLVFLDESGVNTNMTRHYARSQKTNVL